MLMNEKKELLGKICYKYGANADESVFLNDIIFVPLNVNSLYLIFDSNCNIIGVDKYQNDDYSINNFFEKKYCFNCEEDSDNIVPDLMSDSFNNYSLSIIQNISNNCYFTSSNSKNNSYCMFNNKIIEDEYLIELLSYFSFLGCELNYYSYYSCSIQKMGYDAPDFITYLNSVLEKLNIYIDDCIKHNKRPFGYDFIGFLAHSNLTINIDILDNIFKYLLREKGYKIDFINNNLEEIENDIDNSEICIKLFELIK